MGDQAVDYLRRIYESGQTTVVSGIVSISGQPVTISGDHVFVESGVYVIADVAVEVSSGLHIMISGQPVTISGDHVFVESGVYVIADVAVEVSSGLHIMISGQPVTISGDHVYVESGVFANALVSGTVYVENVPQTRLDVTTQSGIGVLISGQHIYVESGVHVVGDFATTTNVSGQPVTISGDHVYVESGVYVIATVSVDSGLGVVIQSGAGVQIDSGVGVQVQSGFGIVLASGLYVVADIAESGIGVQIQSGVGVQVQSGLHVEQVDVIHSGLVDIQSLSPRQQHHSPFLHIQLIQAPFCSPEELLPALLWQQIDLQMCPLNPHSRVSRQDQQGIRQMIVNYLYHRDKTLLLDAYSVPQ